MAPTPSRPRRRLILSRRNEQLKLLAGALDRLSTVIVGGTVLAPFIQDQAFSTVRIAVWGSAALILHATAQFVLSAVDQEE